MSEILFIARKGAGVPMRVVVVRQRAGRWAASAARNLHARGVPFWAICWRLDLSRPMALLALASEPRAADRWRATVRAAMRELEMAA